MVELDLDEVMCARTSPGDSWVNPAEKRMADLNIAWEAAAFARMSAADSDHVPKDHAKWFEKSVKSAGSMAAIRKLVDHSDAVTNSIDVPNILNATVQPVIHSMSQCVERLHCQVNERWVVMEPATKKECESVISFLQAEVCSDLQVGKLQASVVEGTSAERILRAHKLESNRYCFHLRKRLVREGTKPCLPSCPLCPMTSRLPSQITSQLHPLPFPIIGERGHYKPFDEVYGKQNAENPPSGLRASLAPRSVKQSMSGTVCRGLVQCKNCNKQRGVYSKRKSDFSACTELIEASYDTLLFVCGSLSVFSDELKQTHSSALLHHPSAIEKNVTGPNDAMFLIRQLVYVQSDICCDDPIEESIFTSPYIRDASKNLCCFCGSQGMIERASRRTQKEISDVGGSKRAQVSRPYCTECRKENLPRYPRTRKRSSSTKFLSGRVSDKRLKSIKVREGLGSAVESVINPESDNRRAQEMTRSSHGSML